MCRALNIGRSRAEKIIQSMEQAGVVSAAKIGPKRWVLLAKAVLQPVQAPVLHATDAPAAKAPVVNENVPPQNGSMQYIGNLNTHKFHRPSCSALPKESNRTYFDTREEAVADGYVPRKKCNP